MQSTIDSIRLIKQTLKGAIERREISKNQYFNSKYSPYADSEEVKELRDNWIRNGGIVAGLQHSLEILEREAF